VTRPFEFCADVAGVLALGLLLPLAILVVGTPLFSASDCCWRSLASEHAALTGRSAVTKQAAESPGFGAQTHGSRKGLGGDPARIAVFV
jgi:hypothetical protein